jgi:hypothetical protein
MVGKPEAGAFVELRGRPWLVEENARQSIDEQAKIERAPLDAQYFFPLLDFISKRSIQETQRSSTQRAAVIAAAVSLATSVIALLAVLLAKKTF